ncbi:MAG TPA: histidinol dehydrogenase, partial [Clostridia bacterium]|nr:histidinol dehydrogenase [Clostridia bacterium]
MIKIIDIRNGEKNNLFENLVKRSQVDTGDVQKRVEDIIGNIRKNGDKAIFEYTKLFDKVELDSGSIKVTRTEIGEAYKKVDAKLIEVIKKAKQNVESFHQKQKENSWFS